MNHFLLIKGSAGTAPPSTTEREVGRERSEFAGVWREEEDGLEETECETTQEEPKTERDWKTSTERGNHWPWPK